MNLLGFRVQGFIFFTQWATGASAHTMSSLTVVHPTFSSRPGLARSVREAGPTAVVREVSKAKHLRAQLPPLLAAGRSPYASLQAIVAVFGSMQEIAFLPQWAIWTAQPQKNQNMRPVKPYRA